MSYVLNRKHRLGFGQGGMSDILSSGGGGDLLFTKTQPSSGGEFTMGTLQPIQDTVALQTPQYQTLIPIVDVTTGKPPSSSMPQIDISAPGGTVLDTGGSRLGPPPPSSGGTQQDPLLTSCQAAGGKYSATGQICNVNGVLYKYDAGSKQFVRTSTGAVPGGGGGGVAPGAQPSYPDLYEYPTTIPTAQAGGGMGTVAVVGAGLLAALMFLR